MHALANLCAASDQRMGINQRTCSHIRADIDISRWHHDNGRRKIRAIAYRRSTRHDTDIILDTKIAKGDGILIEKIPMLAAMNGDRPIHQFPETKSEENPSLHPRIDAPSACI